MRTPGTKKPYSETLESQGLELAQVRVPKGRKPEIRKAAELMRKGKAAGDLLKLERAEMREITEFAIELALAGGGVERAEALVGSEMPLKLRAKALAREMKRAERSGGP
jgi:hypothetical protein|tara:strand:- start:546 stop:872 length:327 start_codon:yes stop_codon:yes gene_type:complete